MMNSLGDIHITPVAGIVFPSYSNGSILHLTGKAETLYGASARAVMPNMDIISTIYVTGFSFVSVHPRGSSGGSAAAVAAGLCDALLQVHLLINDI
jgi:hypothetical protein